MKILGVIPARYASSRFPGKPLVEIVGKSMIQRVYERSSNCETLDAVVVATDDQRIFDHVKSFGGEVIMTSEHHRNGTERCHEVSEAYPDFDVVINIQGDEPLIEPKQIERVASLFLKNKECQISTLVKEIKDEHTLFNANTPKVVLDKDKKAKYFSRNTIPFLRDVERSYWLSHQTFFKHIGIYGFRQETLKALVKLEPGALEQAEQLEQLRWLENGFDIYVDETEFESIGVDVPEDVALIEQKLKA